MIRKTAATRRVVIVGGGIAGLAVSVRLAQAGLPVTLLEAWELGGAASTRNQGWLHSGGLFARTDADYARQCYASLQQTLTFCPDCVEPLLPAMAYLGSKPDTLIRTWTDAWTSAGVPFEELPVEQVLAQLPGFNRDRLQHAYQLPDRAIRLDVLLTQLAATAEHAGVEIRTGTRVKGFDCRNQKIEHVVTAAGEEVAAQLVVIAGGATGKELCSEFLEGAAGSQVEVELVSLKMHLVSLRAEVARLPFCVVDAEGFNHIPHPPVSVFGIDRWEPVSSPNDLVEPQQVERICARIREFFPQAATDPNNVHAWAGTMIQALRAEQVQPGNSLWPAVIDHAHHAPQITNLVSIFPGRATLWPQAAEDARRIVLSKLDNPPASTAHPPWVAPG